MTDAFTIETLTRAMETSKALYGNISQDIGEGEKMKITLDERPMLNIRQIRSQEITHLIMHALRDFIPDDRLSRANDELHKLLHDIGAEIITDQKRAETGLPPRGPDGWTVEELKTLEIKRLRKMQLIEPHQ